jgi:hypothetical protein
MKESVHIKLSVQQAVPVFKSKHRAPEEPEITVQEGF